MRKLKEKLFLKEYDEEKIKILAPLIKRTDAKLVLHSV